MDDKFDDSYLQIANKRETLIVDSANTYAESVVNRIINDLTEDEIKLLYEILQRNDPNELTQLIEGLEKIYGKEN